MATAYSSIPLTWCANPEWWRSFFEQFNRRTGIISWIGDSRSIPSSDFIAHLQHFFHSWYGNTPGTPLVTMNIGHQWCSQGTNGGGAATRISDASTMFPSLRLADGTTYVKKYTSSDAVWSAYFRPTNAFSGVTRFQGGSYCRAGNWKARIYAATKTWHGANTGEVNYTMYHNALTATGNTAAGLQTSANYIEAADTSTLAFDGSNIFQLDLKGSSATATDIIGCRFLNTTNPAGVIVDCHSEGGVGAFCWTSREDYEIYTNWNVFKNFARALADLGTDAVAIWLGANDLGASVGATDYGKYVYNYGAYPTVADATNTGSMVQSIRARRGPTFPIILIGEVYRSGVDATALDAYPGTLYDSILNDPYVLFINLRLIGERSGITATGYTNWYSDTVHPTTAGAETIAKMLGMAMVGAPASRSATLPSGVVALRP